MDLLESYREADEHRAYLESCICGLASARPSHWQIRRLRRSRVRIDAALRKGVFACEYRLGDKVARHEFPDARSLAAWEAANT